MAMMPDSANGSRVRGESALTERPQPHNLEAERSVLSTMLRDPDINVDVVIEHLGENPEMFYSHIHREIFEAILTLKRERTIACDLVGVAHQLQLKGSLEKIGGDAYLAELYSYVATSVNLESWCTLLRDNFALRKMIGVCTEALIKCYDADCAPNQVVDQIEKSVFDVRNSTERSQMVHIKQSLFDEFRNIQAIINKEINPGILTGYHKLDELTGGLKPGEMFVLAARPSIGKTAMALNIIRNITLCKERYRVLFFSLEMSAGQITRRLICTEANVPESTFTQNFNNSDMTKLTGAVTVLKEANLFIDPTPALSIGALQARARRMKMLENIDLVVIDYLQLMKAGARAESRQTEVAEISSGIKQLAKDLNIPVLVLAQLNRDVEKGANPNALPKLSHLRESGAIEQDADVVTFLHRDRDSSKDLTPEKAAMGVDAKLIVEKNRNGQTGIVNLKFYPRRMLFGVEGHYTADDRPADLD